MCVTTSRRRSLSSRNLSLLHVNGSAVTVFLSSLPPQLMGEAKCDFCSVLMFCSMLFMEHPAKSPNDTTTRKKNKLIKTRDPGWRAAIAAEYLSP
jgi:hypothetical protein